MRCNASNPPYTCIASLQCCYLPCPIVFHLFSTPLSWHVFLRACACRVGAIDIKEFRSILETLGIKLHPSQFEALVEGHFAKLDKDHSGSMDYDEFKKFYQRYLATEQLRKHYVRAGPFQLRL